LNRPFVLGLSGAVIVCAAIGLSYVVDSEPGKETAADLKTQDRSTDRRGPDKTPSDVSPHNNAVASKTPDRSTGLPVPDKLRSFVSPRQKKGANVGPGKSGTSGRLAPRKPTFDVVRVNPRGDAVIAGRASPNAAVIVRDGQKEVGTAKADARGEWVVVPRQPLPKGSRELTLSATSRDGTAMQSNRNVVIVVPDRTPQNATESKTNRASGSLAVLVPRQGRAGSIVLQKPSETHQESLGIIANKDRVKEPIGTRDTTQASITESKTNRASGSLAVSVPRQGRAGSIVLQKPSETHRASLGTINSKDRVKESTGTRDTTQVSIDAVDYDEAGNVTISGNAGTKVPLTVYIDNRHAASGSADPQGRWRVVPAGALAPGIHTLRVDQLGDGGKVTGRAETQFIRAKSATAVPGNAVVHVVSGNSLWRIARRVYGRGYQYSVIYDANREQIRDPDLIYPGQIFFVPHAN